MINKINSTLVNQKDKIPSAMDRVLWILVSLYKGSHVYEDDYIKKYKRGKKTLERDIILVVFYTSVLMGYAMEYYYNKDKKYYALIME